MAWLTGWSYRKKLTTNSARISAALSNFPVAVFLDADNFTFAKALASGNDVRFTSSDGETLLKYEREHHASPTAIYHVKVPSIAADAGTDFYLYYGKSDAADGADAANVWDSNFIGVWHKSDGTVGEDTQAIRDSTANANHGTKDAANQPIEAAGKIGRGQTYGGTTHGVEVADDDFNMNAVTVSAWIYNTSRVDYMRMVHRHDTVTSNRGFGIARGYLASSGDHTFAAFFNEVNGTTGYRARSLGNINLDTWYHVLFTYDTTNRVRFYVDGAIQADSASDTGWGGGAGASLTFGRRANAALQNFPGTIDEVRVSDVVRSTSWIAAEFYSGGDDLLTYGEEAGAPDFTKRTGVRIQF